MCGRYELHPSPAAIALAFGLAQPPDIGARYNIAPTQQVSVIRIGRTGSRELAQLRWGLVPFWAKDISIGNKMINARGETVALKPGFRDSFRKARCLLPADGFYEWAKLVGGGKQPMHIGMRDGKPFALAGLWARWRPPEGDPVETCTIVTTDANELLRHIHDRMPVIVAPADYERWLDSEQPGPAELVRPYPAEAMRAYPVSTHVNTPKYDNASLIEEIAT